MGQVIEFTGATSVPEDPAITLERAKGWGLKSVVIIGFTPDDELQFGGSISDAPEILLLLELAKKRLFETVDP